MLTQNVLRKLLIGAAAATALMAVVPAFANPAEEAADDYDGWRAAQRTGITQQTKIQNGHLFYRSNREVR
jgi:hypothetical protein